MKLSTHEQKALDKSAKNKRRASIVSQIERHPGRCVGVSTAQARMKKWGWDIDKACTTPNMNFRG